MDNKPSPTCGRENPKTELEEAREFLGPLAAQYSDNQIAQLSREMHAMAELLLDIYLYKKGQQVAAKKTVKEFDTPSPAS